jgi:hypothetical protein
MQQPPGFVEGENMVYYLHESKNLPENGIDCSLTLCLEMFEYFQNESLYLLESRASRCILIVKSLEKLDAKDNKCFSMWGCTKLSLSRNKAWDWTSSTILDVYTGSLFET